MADLAKIKTEELEAEIKRRKDRHDFIIQGMAFTLNLEEIIDLQNQLNKINPPLPLPPNTIGVMKEILGEEIEKRRDRERVQPPINIPINIPNWPGYPKGPSDYPQPPTIWCSFKPEVPIWNKSATGYV